MIIKGSYKDFRIIEKSSKGSYKDFRIIEKSSKDPLMFSNNILRGM
jgi:hypothetical protein